MLSAFFTLALLPSRLDLIVQAPFRSFLLSENGKIDLFGQFKFRV
jgi:hypothetical protein